MRGIFALCLAALVAGCGGRPSLPDAVPPLQLAAAGAIAPLPAPELREDRLVASDGAALPLQRWLPAGPPKAVVLALHGFNDYANAFALPAAAWKEHGIATYAYDQRGFGRAPRRGRWAGERQLVADADTALALLRERFSGTPLYLLGESMGGAIAILAASGAMGAPRPDVTGVILVAPAVWGRQTMTLIERVGLWLADLMPSLSWSASALPVRVHPSDNIPMLRAYSADPLIIKRTRADTLNGLVDLMGAALAAAPRLDAPLLLLYGEHDEIVPRAPVARFVAALPERARQSQRVALYPRGYHMLLRDLDGPLLAEDVAAWIAAPAVALPSGFDRDARARLAGAREPLSTTLRVQRR